MIKIHKYVKDVLDNKILTGNYIKMACQRHVDDINNRKSKGLIWRPEKGQEIIDFVSHLRHWKGSKAGERIHLEPHQDFYFQSLFGWYSTNEYDEVVRRFKTSYKEISRKNGKTSESAIKALYHVYLDNKQGPQVYFAATKEDQARIGFRDAQEIAKNQDW